MASKYTEQDRVELEQLRQNLEREVDTLRRTIQRQKEEDAAEVEKLRRKLDELITKQGKQ